MNAADLVRTSADSGRLRRAILRSCLLLPFFGACGVAQAQAGLPLNEPSAPNLSAKRSAPENPQSNRQGQDNQGQNDKPTPAPSTEQKVKDLPQEAEKETEKLGQIALVKAREWELSWLVGPYSGRQRPLVPLTIRERQRIYLQQTFTTPSPYIKRMIVAGVDQWRESPLQWGDGWGAYGKRFASREGQFFTADTLTAFGDAALKYEPMYDQCQCSGFWPRTRHAILRNFVTYDSSERRLRPQWALYGGAFAGGMVSSTWRPSSHGVLTNGVFAMVGQAGYGSLLNFFIEFAVDINHKLGGRRSRFQPDGPK